MDMKQSLTLFVTVAICSALFVVLMWVPFTYPLTASQVIKYALIGAVLGLVFYLVGIKKTATRRRVTRKPQPHKGASKKPTRARAGS